MEALTAAQNHETQITRDTGGPYYSSKHMRILLVEDEERIDAFIRKGLQEELYTVDVARDGAEALDIALGAAYDLIILDVRLPGRDGIAVCRELRSQGNTTPVLMLTARDSIDDRVRGLDAGADDYLVKPFAFQELLARLRALDRKRVAAGERRE